MDDWVYDNTSGDQATGLRMILPPFCTYTGYFTESVDRHIHTIKYRATLGFTADLVPRLDKFVGNLRDYVKRPASDRPVLQLNDMRFVLGHRRLDLGNIMVDPVKKAIVGIEQWDHAAAVPAWR